MIVVDAETLNNNTTSPINCVPAKTMVTAIGKSRLESITEIVTYTRGTKSLIPIVGSSRNDPEHRNSDRCRRGKVMSTETIQRERSHYQDK